MIIVQSKSIFKYNKVWKKLQKYNAEQNEFIRSNKVYPFKKVNFYVMDGRVVLGGALCEIKWNWLYIDILCVDERMRGQDLGTKLITEVEKYAREKGYEGVYLETFGFQARPFYEKMGFTVTGELEGLPPDSVMYTLAKKF